MKMTPELAKAAEKMKPGVISRDGFFGHDERDLPTIINDQHASCFRLGIHYRDIAAAMRRVGKAGMAGLGGPVTVEKKWEVVADENRGKIPCPWPEPGVYQKTVYTVKNLATATTAQYSELTIHLVEKHDFFRGVGAPFHNSPEHLVAVLEISPSDELPEVLNLSRA